jgi:hypothetical protein
VAGFVSLKAVKTGLGRQRLAEESKTLAPPTSTVPQGQIFRQCVRGSHAARLTAPAPATREERMSDQRFRRLRAMARAQRCELTKGTWAGAGTVLSSPAGYFLEGHVTVFYPAPPDISSRTTRGT